jgi:HlyD family secretion protein
MKLLFPGFALFILFSCRTDEKKIQPVVEDISESVYASGIVKSKDQYQMFSTVNGIIKEVLVTEGESVKKGTPLIRIFNKISVLNAQNAGLAAEFAQLSANQGKLDELKGTVELAANKVKIDSLMLQRQQNLWSQKIGTRVQLEQSELAYQNSLNNYRSARIRYNDLKRQLTLNASQSQNTFQINSSIADEYILKSEVDGKIYSILKSPGELVTTQSAVALLGDGESFLLELQVDENDIVRIRENQKVLISMDSYKGQVFEARITKINPVMNERSKSFTIEANFTTQPPVLYPFLTTEANIVIQEKKNALTIPRACLVDDTYVLLEGNQKTKVTIGLMDYQKVEILSGLTAQQYILIPNN